jgi:hypothetical protein
MKRKWTDPEILIPIIVAAISSILAPIILSQLNVDNSKEQIPNNTDSEENSISSSSALNSSQFLGNWYYTDFYNTNPSQVPVRRVSINQDTGGVVQVQFIGYCIQTCSYTGNATGNYSNDRIEGSYVYEADEYYFDLTITPTNKLLITLYKDNRTSLYAEEYLVRFENLVDQ